MVAARDVLEEVVLVPTEYACARGQNILPPALRLVYSSDDLNLQTHPQIGGQDLQTHPRRGGHETANSPPKG